MLFPTLTTNTHSGNGCVACRERLGGCSSITIKRPHEFFDHAGTTSCQIFDAPTSSGWILYIYDDRTLAGTGNPRLCGSAVLVPARTRRQLGASIPMGADTRHTPAR